MPAIVRILLAILAFLAQGVSVIGSDKRTLPMLADDMAGTTLAGAAVTIIDYYAPFMIAATVLTSVGGGC